MAEVRIAAELRNAFPIGGPVGMSKAMSDLAVGQAAEIKPAYDEQIAGETIPAYKR